MIAFVAGSRDRWRDVSVCAALLASIVIASRANGQAPINSNVALQPPKGGLILRQQFRYTEAEFDKGGKDLDFRQISSSTTAVYGLTDAITLIFNQPLVFSRRIQNNVTGTTDTDRGFADFAALSKIRLLRNDFGSTDTARFDLLGGIEFPTGTDAFSSESFDPIVGGVFTLSRGRHFFDADLLWKFNTAGGGLGVDLLRYDGAYIYRLWPEKYSGPDPVALNILLELNGFYETNGDNELFVSPGVQYVTTRVILEATVQIPAWQDLENRPETEFIIGFGIRVQF